MVRLFWSLPAPCAAPAPCQRRHCFDERLCGLCVQRVQQALCRGRRHCGVPRMRHALPPRLLPGRGRLRARSAARRGLCLAAAAARPAGGRAAGPARRRRAARVPRLRRAKPPRGAVLRKLRHAPFGPRGPAGPRRGLGPGRGKPLCAGGRARAGLWAARGRRTARLGRDGTACRQL